MAGDVPADWLAEHARDGKPGPPLSRLHASLFWQLPRGGKSVVFEIPTVSDALAARAGSR